MGATTRARRGAAGPLRTAVLVAVVAVAAVLAPVGHHPGAAQPAIGAPTLVDWMPDPPPSWPAPPPASARAFLLVDATTGQVLAGRDADQPLLVASTVKLLTMLTALQHLDLDDTVAVGPEADPGDGGAGASVDPGESWTVRDLLDAVMVRSGNDAARALAGAVTNGDLDAFTDLMAATAADLGVEDVVLTEPTGLGDGNELSARALGTIARAALADPRIRASAGQDTVALPDIGEVGNRNLLIGEYPGATGLKTGHTSAAGWCLVASAERDGRELVAVVLGAREDPDRFEEARALLDHGFEALRATDLPTLQARVPGGWETVVEDGHVWTAPGTSADVALRPVGDDGVRLQLTADGGGAPVELGSRTAALPGTGSGDSAGAALVSALYRTMREVHLADGWSDRQVATAGERDSG